MDARHAEGQQTSLIQSKLIIIGQEALACACLLDCSCRSPQLEQVSAYHVRVAKGMENMQAPSLIQGLEFERIMERAHSQIAFCLLSN